MQEKENKEAVREAVRKGGFTAVFIRRPVLTIMCSLSVVILGFMAYSGMGVGLFPNMEVPYVLVQTTLAGASAEEIETSVTKIIEESVNQIEGIDELTSTSSEGTSLVVVKFDMDKDRDVAAQEVRDKVDLVTNDLPDGTDAPVIMKLDADAISVLNIVVSGDRDIIELTEIAKKQVKENIENTRGVGSVTIVGGREREVHVIVNPFKLYSLGLSINAVKNALIDQNVEVPGGRVEQQHQEYTLRVLGRVDTVPGFNDIFIARKNGTSIKVSDVGYAEDSGEYDRESTYLNGRRAVTLEVTKQSGTNTLAVIQGVKDKLELIAPTLPKDINISLMMDQSGSIRASVNTVLEHLILGGILAGIMVLVFMGSLRSTFIAFLAMPISVIGAFIFMNMKGFTIDSMTLLGLTVAVGIVIDDAIVMLENIYRHMEKYDKFPMVAALDGSREITSTVVATTLSILVIFLPLAYMSGIIGRVVSSYGLTVVFAIALSGLVALTLTPMLCAKMLKKQTGRNRLNEIVDHINESLVNLYLPMLKWSIHHRKTMVIISVLCILSMFPMLGIVGGEFFPQEDSGKIQINVEAPVGTSYQDTQEILTQIEADVRRMPYVKDVLLSAGVGDNSFSDSQPSNRGNVRFELEDREVRHGITTTKYLDLTREMMKKYEGLKTSSYIVSDGPGGRKDVEFLISGPDIDKLTEYGHAILAKLGQDNRALTDERERMSGEMARLAERRNALESELNDTNTKLWEEYQLTDSEARALCVPFDSLTELRRQVAETRGKIRALGNVNVGAIDEYKEVKERYDFLKAQVTDVEKARAELTRMIAELCSEMEELFATSFKEINRHFGQIFRELFGGGHARLYLSDPENVLDSGIEIEVSPPGKVIKNLSALSGGEQSLVAISIYFAILNVNPAPFCILDEIEAALDDVNVNRYAQYLHRMTANTQFIVITHRRGTMEAADVLYGVTMQEDGVSKILRLDLDSVTADLIS